MFSPRSQAATCEDRRYSRQGNPGFTWAERESNNRGWFRGQFTYLPGCCALWNCVTGVGRQISKLSPQLRMGREFLNLDEQARDEERSDVQG